MSNTTAAAKTPYGEKVKKSKHRHERSLPSPMTLGADGKDHINVGDDATTPLGTLLNHRSDIPFLHSHFGKFHTLEGFNLWILSAERDDRLRQLQGPKLRALSKKITKQPETIPNFKAVIIDTYYQSIVQNEQLKRQVAESTLPFDVYYVVAETGLRIRPARYNWLLWGLEEIRKAIQENRAPQLKKLLDINRRQGGIYDGLVAMMKLQAPETN